MRLIGRPAIGHPAPAFHGGRRRISMNRSNQHSTCPVDMRPSSQPPNRGSADDFSVLQSPSTTSRALVPPSKTPDLGADRRSGRRLRAPEWLVSVRDLDEAITAADFSIDIVDLKEPRSGPLAPVAVKTWRAVHDWKMQSPRSAESPFRLSAALGEFEQAMEIAAAVPEGFDFAKAGPESSGSEGSLVKHWHTLRERLPDPIELVAVAYADHSAARTLSPESVLSAAAAQGFRRLLLDTFVKDGRSAIECLGPERIRRLGRLAAKHRLWWSLAGSIRLDDVHRTSALFAMSPWRPQCIAVRGDVCGQDRTTGICRKRLGAWQRVFSKRAVPRESPHSKEMQNAAATSHEPGRLTQAQSSPVIF